MYLYRLKLLILALAFLAGSELQDESRDEAPDSHCALIQTALPRERRVVNASVIEAMNQEVKKEAETISNTLKKSWQNSSVVDALAKTWYNAYVFTAERTLAPFSDGSVFVSTGDIRQMWLRDSSIQLQAYLPLAARLAADSPLRQVLEAAMARQVRFFLSDPYASAFYNETGPGRGQGPDKTNCAPSADCPGCACQGCQPACGPWTYQTDFELDSPLFMLLLHHDYWRTTGSTRHISDEFRQALKVLVELIQTEQEHHSKSAYNRKAATNTRFAEGIGLIWSQALPSDDASQPYNIPQNMMAAVMLQKGSEMAKEVLQDMALSEQLMELSSQVEKAINRYGVVEGPNAKVFAFQVDGLGNFSLQDDANYPNLLWMPVLGFKDPKHRYNATRDLVLSSQNPSFVAQGYAGYAGLGSSHASHGLRSYGPECQRECIWHLGLIMQGITAPTSRERLEQLQKVLNTSDGAMHEGFSAQDPSRYNRDEFGWANSLFAQWVLDQWLHGP